MADCSTCKEKARQAEPIPYIAFESMKSTMERTVKRLWILLIILVVLLVGSNIAWTTYEAQFETVEFSQEVEQDANNGFNTFIGGDYNGTAESEDNGQAQG